MYTADLARQVMDDDEAAEKPGGRVDDDPAPYPATDDEDEEDYGTYTRALWDEQEGALEPLHQVWIQNLLFLAGHQWWTYNGRTGIWGPQRVPEWKERPVSNLCLPYFKHVLAKATKNKPAWTAIAGSTDPEDIHAAKLAEEALEAKWMELRMARVLRRAIAWVIPTGNAFIYPYWNEQTGNIIPLTVPMDLPEVDPETGEMSAKTVDVPVGPDGEPVMIMDQEHGIMVPDLTAEPIYIDEGEIGAKVYSPFQVRVDPGAECDEEVTFAIIAEVLPTRDIHRKYPDSKGKVSAEDVGVIDQYDKLVGQMWGAGGDMNMVSGSTERDQELPKALVLHYHEKPTPDYPEGRYWCTSGTALLEEPQPLPDGIWPCMVHMTDVEVPGRYHAMSTMEAIVGLNREYNDLNAMIKEHHNLLLRGKWLVPIGSNIKKGQITTQPGEVIQHTPGLPPKQAEIKPLPNVVYQERERVMQDFQTVSGIHRISHGSPPPGVTSGTAFLTLQEADDTDLGPFLAMMEESVAELAWKFLQIIQQRYDDERLVAIPGDDRRFSVKQFRGADLQGVIDVQPQHGSSAPWNQTARQSLILDLLNKPAGAEMFRDEETGMFDRARVARLLPVAGLESLGSLEDIDINEALREEEDFSEFVGTHGEVVPQVTPWQNHQIHLRQHTRMLKSAAFERWPAPAKAAFIGHWQQTKDTIMQMQMQAAMQQQMMGAALGGGEEDAGPDDGGEPTNE